MSASLLASVFFQKKTQTIVRTPLVYPLSMCETLPQIHTNVANSTAMNKNYK